MKIINWNVGRPTANKSQQITDKLNQLDGDILILTETNSTIIPLANYHHISTDLLPHNHDGINYNANENRTSIFSKYPITKTYKTFDNFTSLCADIETPFGSLTIYATIIGVFGGKGNRFNEDLQHHISDFEKLLNDKQVCIVGDYNTTFNGFTYPSHSARDTMNSVFDKFHLTNLTASIDNCVDHISISNEFLKNKKVQINDVWNTDKKLSDHIGTAITLSEQQEKMIEI
jgi:hypothetical protein